VALGVSAHINAVGNPSSIFPTSFFFDQLQDYLLTRAYLDKQNLSEGFLNEEE